MKALTSRFKTSLFLMELIFSLLILSLAATVCIQVFLGARNARREAREWNHIQTLTTTVGEFLEGCDGTAGEFPEESDSTAEDFPEEKDGTAGEFLRLYPEGVMENGILLYYYDVNLDICSPEDAFYSMEVAFTSDKHTKNASVSFYKNNPPADDPSGTLRHQNAELLYQQELTFPLFSTRKESKTS